MEFPAAGPDRAGNLPPEGRVRRPGHRRDRERLPRDRNKPSAVLLLPTAGRGPQPTPTGVEADALRLEERCLLFRSRDGISSLQGRRPVVSGSGAGFHADRRLPRVLSRPRRCLLRRWRAGRLAGGRLLRRLDHVEGRRSVQGAARNGRLVGLELKPRIPSQRELQEQAHHESGRRTFCRLAGGSQAPYTWMAAACARQDTPHNRPAAALSAPLEALARRRLLLSR